jgi:alpha-mannosidase
MQIDNGDLWLNFDAPLSGGSMESAFTRNHPDPYDRSKPDELVNRGTFRPRILSATLLPSEPGALHIEQRGELRFWRIVIPYTTRILLRESSRRIEFQTDLVPTGKNYRIRAAFPTRLGGGFCMHEVAFGIQERGEGEHAAQNWASLVDERAGLAILNRGTPGMSVDQGVMLLSLFRSVAMEYKTASSDSFQEGIPHTFEYAIVPHAPDALAEVVQEGQAFNFPPLPCKPAAPELTGWEIKGAALSSLRRLKEGIFLRLYEPVGKPSSVTISLPKHLRAFASADAFGRAIEEPRPCSEGIDFKLKPFEIVALLFYPSASMLRVTDCEA